MLRPDPVKDQELRCRDVIEEFQVEIEGSVKNRKEERNGKYVVTESAAFASTSFSYSRFFHLLMIITIHLTGPEIKDEKEETVPECSKVDTGGNGKSKMQRPRFWKTPASWKSREALMECEHCGAQRKGGRENIFSSVTFVFQVRVTCSQPSLSPTLEGSPRTRAFAVGR